MGNRAWAITAALIFFPVAALIHHSVFFRSQCILNPFEVPDYSIAALRLLVTADPSIGLGLAAMLAIWRIGLYWQPLRLLTLAFVLAFVPLTIWLWDIPLTGRYICLHFHDNRTELRSLHLYIVGVIATPVLFLVLRHLGLSANLKPHVSRNSSSQLAQRD